MEHTQQQPKVEYMVAAHALGHLQTKPTKLYRDNQSAVALTHNLNKHGKIKHIEIKYYLLRCQVQDGILNFFIILATMILQIYLRVRTNRSMHCCIHPT